MGRKLSTSIEQDVKMFAMKKEGKTISEIAKEMGTSLSTAQRAIKRAQSIIEKEPVTINTIQETQEKSSSSLVSSPIFQTVEPSMSTSSKKSFVSKVKTFFTSLLG